MFFCLHVLVYVFAQLAGFYFIADQSRNMGAVGEQCCWEPFRGAVLVSPGGNRNWEAGDCLDALNLLK